MSRTRDIAAFLGVTEAGNTSNNALLNTASPVGLDSSQVSSIAASSGLTVYSTLNDLPSSGLTSGDQAFVSSSRRFYISNGSGWYNVALINATPSLTIDPTGVIELSTDGTPTTITLTATDSDNAVAGLTYSFESDGSFGGLATISQDSSVFTITPLSSDSATTTSSTLTFKASDGISFGSGDRTLTLTFKVTNSNYTTLLAKADTADSDNQVDASTNALTITENGDVTSTALSPYHPGGYSYYFAGDGGDYFTIESPSQSGFQFGTSTDFCIEMWIYAFDASASHILCDMRPDATNGAYIGALSLSSNQISFGFNSTTYLTSSSNSVVSNAWNHIVFNRDGSNINIFVNGTREATTALAFNFLVGKYRLFKNAFSGGGIADGSGGYIRDYRVVKGNSVYGAGTTCTQPTEPLTNITGTSLLLFQKPYLADTVGSETISFVGGETKRVGPYDYEKYTKTGFGGSIYNDGNGDYLNVSGSNLQSVGSVSGEPFTIEFWYNYSAVGSNGNGLITKGTAGSTGAGDILTIELSPATRAISCTLDGLYSGYEIISSTLLKVNVWYHIALVKNSSNVYTLYINGKSDGTYTAGGTISTSSNFFIGTNYYAPTDVQRQSEAYFSDVRVVSDAVYTSNFTPPTAPLTAITNTELLTLTNKNDIWDASSGTVLTKAGNVTASNTQRKFATSSAMYFDGTGDYLEISDLASLQFGTGDFTIEGWVNKPGQGANGYDALIGIGQTVSGTTGWYLEVSTDRGIFFTINNNSVSYGTWTNDGAWHHIAVTRSSGAVNIWLDGVSVASGTISVTVPTTGTTAKVGSYFNGTTNYTFNGYAQDVRVTKGLAGYTSSFTPPTSEFLG